MEFATTVTSKGQVVVPVFYRKKLGISPGKMVKFSYDSQLHKLTLTPVENFLFFKGVLKGRKKYDKKVARKLFVKDLIKGKV